MLARGKDVISWVVLADGRIPGHELADLLDLDVAKTHTAPHPLSSPSSPFYALPLRGCSFEKHDVNRF